MIPTLLMFYVQMNDELNTVELGNNYAFKSALTTALMVIFNSAVFGENPRYCYSLGGSIVTFCNISDISEDIYLQLEYVFTIIQRAIHKSHTIKGDSKCIFFRIMLLFRLFIPHQVFHSRALAQASGALVSLGFTNNYHPSFGKCTGNAPVAFKRDSMVKVLSKE